MRKAAVYYTAFLAGILKETDEGDCLANSTLQYIKAYPKPRIMHKNRKQEVVYLPEGHTTHYRKLA
jgi:hypothetical protein